VLLIRLWGKPQKRREREREKMGYIQARIIRPLCQDTVSNNPANPYGGFKYY
jgi:hypothetical protein